MPSGRRQAASLGGIAAATRGRCRGNATTDPEAAGGFAAAGDASGQRPRGTDARGRKRVDLELAEPLRVEKFHCVGRWNRNGAWRSCRNTWNTWNTSAGHQRKWCTGFAVPSRNPHSGRAPPACRSTPGTPGNRKIQERAQQSRTAGLRSRPTVRADESDRLATTESAIRAGRAAEFGSPASALIAFGRRRTVAASVLDRRPRQRSRDRTRRNRFIKSLFPNAQQRLADQTKRRRIADFRASQEHSIPESDRFLVRVSLFENQLVGDRRE